FYFMALKGIADPGSAGCEVDHQIVAIPPGAIGQNIAEAVYDHRVSTTLIKEPIATQVDAGEVIHVAVSTAIDSIVAGPADEVIVAAPAVEGIVLLISDNDLCGVRAGVVLDSAQHLRFG